jgi:ATP-dependent DNA helicase RecG
LTNEASPVLPVPPWADADLSQRLTDLAAEGESQELEYKERFPEQARDLAKEIAAFATSNSGIILLGVAKSGEIVGLTNCEAASGRESLLDRVAGICANTVKPSVTPRLRFASVKGRTVLAIDVPKSDAPLHYVAGVPYVRQITTSRPAEPQEVIDHILAWHRVRNASDESSPEAAFLHHTAMLVVEVLVHAGELEEQQVNPWFDDLRHNLAWLAGEARELASTAPPEFSEMVVTLEALAADLDRAAHERLALNSGWDAIDAAARGAMARASEIRQRWIDPHASNEKSVAELHETLQATARKLTSFAGRLQEMDDQGRLREIQSTAGELGLVLLRAATLGIGLGDEERVAELMAIGRMLRDVETRTIYADGGQSARRVLGDVEDAAAKLKAWVKELSAPPTK